MRIRPDSRRRMGEHRRYFPDFADGLPEGWPELEADHNSYLAGGYAEEFGYRAQPEWSRGVPVLDAESPDESPESHRQAWGTHPGYPVRAHPIELGWVLGDASIRAARREVLKYVHRSSGEPRETELHGIFFRVSDRSYEHDRHQVIHRLIGVSTRVAAAVMSLRWSLGRLR
jgi:hypothetical protein